LIKDPANGFASTHVLRVNPAFELANKVVSFPFPNVSSDQSPSQAKVERELLLKVSRYSFDGWLTMILQHRRYKAQSRMVKIMKQCKRLGMNEFWEKVRNCLHGSQADKVLL
jgi:predicted TIM-barrel fold metal-dependent hydrolase